MPTAALGVGVGAALCPGSSLRSSSSSSSLGLDLVGAVVTPVRLNILRKLLSREEAMRVLFHFQKVGVATKKKRSE
jgi:hypothetical protein